MHEPLCQVSHKRIIFLHIILIIHFWWVSVTDCIKIFLSFNCNNFLLIKNAMLTTQCIATVFVYFCNLFLFETYASLWSFNLLNIFLLCRLRKISSYIIIIIILRWPWHQNFSLLGIAPPLPFRIWPTSYERHHIKI